MDWYWEVTPLIGGRGRLIHTDGASVDWFY